MSLVFTGINRSCMCGKKRNTLSVPSHAIITIEHMNYPFSNKIDLLRSLKPNIGVSKYFSYGSTWENKLMPGLRLGYTTLNSSLHKRRLHDDGCCDVCGELEDRYHYFFDCGRYTNLRLTLEQTVSNLGVPLSIENYLNCHSPHENINKSVFSAVTDFIHNSRRFDNRER